MQPTIGRWFWCAMLAFAAVVAHGDARAADLPNADRPHIVWIIVEDMSADFGCYGQRAIETPHVDALAASGVRFTDAVVTAPVCSACRSALVTGMYQTSIGAHHHRSGRGKEKIYLPDGVRLVPALFQQAGYQTLNLTFDDFMKSDDAVTNDPSVKVAKTDYNFQWNAQVYERTHWTRRNEGTPFFAQVQLHGGKMRGGGDGNALAPAGRKDPREYDCGRRRRVTALSAG